MATSEGVYELHWQRREYGQLTLQLYARASDGQFRHIDSWEAAPFDMDGVLLRSVLRRVLLDVTPGLT